MQPFRLHVFACDQKKPDGVPCCSARGSAKTIDALRKEIAAGGLIDEVQVTVCGSLGLCERGPNVVVYPEGVWYSGVTPDDVGEIVQSHFRDGRPVERLMNRDAAAVAGEIRTNRDRMLAAMRARDASGALPDDLVQTLRGYQESRVLSRLWSSMSSPQSAKKQPPRMCPPGPAPTLGPWRCCWTPWWPWASSRKWAAASARRR
jgi:(2Fe-2S) ferredoxin